MKKTLQVALREFVSTVGTRGFIIGILITPLMISLAIFGVSKMKQGTPLIPARRANASSVGCGTKLPLICSPISPSTTSFSICGIREPPALPSAKANRNAFPNTPVSPG